MTRLIDFAHEMAYRLLFRYLEIEIRFHTTAVHMRRHRIPYATRVEFGHAHLQLAGRQDLIDEHLVDITFVTHLEASHMGYDGIRFGYFLIRIGAMCGRRVEVEQGRFIGIQALKLHFAVSATEVKRLFIIEFEDFVSCDHATLTAYVENTHLAAGEEERRLQRIDGFE